MYSVDSKCATNGQGLQIVIDNTKPCEDESMDHGGEDMLQLKDETDILEEETGIVENDENSTEFQVNLDKVPATLQNTIHSEKIYLNESVRLEPNVPEDLNHISDEDRIKLYASLGLTEENFMTEEESKASSLDIISGEKPEDVPTFTSAASFRKEALHLFGVDELSTNELFEYFKDYKPLAVEWINDSSCNVIWRNAVHAANALLGMSVEYDETKESESFLKTVADKEEGEDGELEDDEAEELKFSKRLPPQGCRWRKGVKSVKKHQIYIRYVRKSDKKIKGAEARSKYYVKYGNPNYGNMKGLLTNSMRSKLKARQLKEASSDLDEESTERRPVTYDFDDDYAPTHVSDTEIEEFGTSESKPAKQTSPVKALVTKSKREFEKRKSMGMYADEIVATEAPKVMKRMLYSDEQESFDLEPEQKFDSSRIRVERPFGSPTKKSRYEPYSFSKSRLSIGDNPLKSRLSGLRSDDSRSNQNRDRRSLPSRADRDRDRERPWNRDSASRTKNTRDSHAKSESEGESDDDDIRRLGLKSTIKSVVHETNDLRNRLNRFK